jgi:SAM-dependent methyltransferase
MARGILHAMREQTGVHAASLSELASKEISRTFRVYDTQLPFYYHTCCYPLPDLLAAVRGVEVQLSRYRPLDVPGSPIDGKWNVTNQNLECLTFPDASFDLVMTSDVMEHVRLDDIAHHEIRRVLKPGGVYIFTVPHTRAEHDTLKRVVIHDPSDPAKDEYVMEKEYHGDANDLQNAALSYRVYGTELDDKLQKLGFRVDYTRQDFPETGIVNTELFYCMVSG